MTPSEIHEQLAELDHTLADHTDVLMRARADLNAAQAEIQTIEAGWADMLIDIAFGRQEAQAKTQARARLRDLRHEVADAEILLEHASGADRAHGEPPGEHHGGASR